MFNANANVPSLSDIAAVTGNNDGFGGNNGWWVLILLFAIFGGWGNRGGYGYGGSGGVADNYVLSSDFGRLQEQLNSATSNLERKLDGVNNGQCSAAYENLNQINGVNNNIFASQNALMTQLNAMQSQQAACCCETKNLIGSSFAELNYNLANQSCQTRQAVADGTRAIIDNDNANYRALNDRLTQMEMAGKDRTIAELQQKIAAAELAASQAAQNNYIISALRPAPVPAYMVQNPNTSFVNGCCNCGFTGYNC